jgi:hypothetical protein
MDEIRIIPPWAWFFALLVFLALPTALGLLSLFDKSHPPIAVLVPAGFVSGTFMACGILLVGYINRDAGRRGMSGVLWTLLAFCIPNALGIVLYFVLRKPRVSNCPQCGAAVEPGFGFCPGCRCRLNPVCPQCQRGLNTSGRFCPYCGADLAAAG